MIGFGKHKETIKKGRYKVETAAEDDVLDVLLTEKSIVAEPVLSVALVEAKDHENTEEPLYDLEEHISQRQMQTEEEMTANLNTQIQQLADEYEKVNQQLEKSLLAVNNLSVQLGQSKKNSKVGYIALTLAGLSFIAGAGACVVTVNMQRDIADLQSSLNSLAQKNVLAQKQLAAKDKDLDNQFSQVNQKINNVLAIDNLNDVLQVTRDLKKQIDALANKNLAALNGQPPSASANDNPEKISLPSLTAKKAEPAQAENQEKVAEPAEKAAKSMVKNEPVKEPKTEKLPTVETANVEETGKWFMVFGTFKDKNAADKFEKAGISVQVDEIKQKNQTRYRISSKTFTTKQEAQQQADYVQKNLKIHAKLRKAK